MSKSALITGATGLLGRQVLKGFERSGWEAKGTGFTRASPPTILKLDLGSEADVATTLELVKFVPLYTTFKSISNQQELKTSSAANRFPDKCDNDPEGTCALNVEASGSLARLCAASSILLIYISTDYVFPGTEGDAPYESTSTVKPPNLYGQTKYEGEKAVLAEFEKVGKEGWGVVLRVPVLYGEAGKPAESAVNVLMDVVRKAQEKGANVKMDHWAIRYPTNTEDVGRVLQDVATKYLSTKDKTTLPRVLQFSSEDKMTKYEICEVFAEIMGLPLDGMVANTEGNDPNASVQRPYDCHLSTKTLKDIGIPVTTQDFKGWWRREARAFRK
ncbi:related to methionine adenosyltransferase regulatory beta subunit [Rhynchosporium agropyri]|uniref:Related to methionine adenosyltransferase regulatory beta subunit n=1 Tax=Rhynchosporium agropyri TaxID=914238 RepID=A0A1E1LDM5_9HELO|nr:related to methionine adenosyltransferase regulatory beta subunit [Rhynchosporium agropyri]